MLKTTLTHLRHLGFLTTALTLALIANFAYGAWSNPTVAPTGGNTPAPINVGTDNQLKDGAFDANLLAVSHGAPTLRFFDYDYNDFRIHQNNDEILFQRQLADGSWRANMRFHAADNDDLTSYYTWFNNAVWSNEYCDGAGNNCFDPTDVGETESRSSVPVYFGNGNEIPLMNAVRGGNPWQTYDYPAVIPENASGIILGAHMVSEDRAYLYLDTRSLSMPETTIAKALPHNDTDSDSAGAYTVVTVPYSSDRKIDIRFFSPGRTDDAQGASRVSIVGYVGGTPPELHPCDVEVEYTILDQSSGNVLRSDTDTIVLYQGSRPRFGGVVEIRSNPNERYSRELIQYERNESQTSLGYWTETTFLANEEYIRGIRWKNFGPLLIEPGNTITRSVFNNASVEGDRAREEGRVRATVLSCS